MHVDDAGEGFDGGAGLGADLEAAGDGNFDFAGGEVEDDGDAATAAGRSQAISRPPSLSSSQASKNVNKTRCSSALRARARPLLWPM